MRPPAMDRQSIYHPLHDRDKYAHLPPHVIPDAESLRDTKRRAVVYWNDVSGHSRLPSLRLGLCSAGRLRRVDGEDVALTQACSTLPLIQHPWGPGTDACASSCVLACR